MKVVNAGLAARSLPGAAQPVYGGPLGRGASRVILHVDMDCFFVSVLVKNRPELKDKPVAVAHNGERSLAMVAREVRLLWLHMKFPQPAAWGGGGRSLVLVHPKRSPVPRMFCLLLSRGCFFDVLCPLAVF